MHVVAVIKLYIFDWQCLMRAFGRKIPKVLIFILNCFLLKPSIRMRPYGKCLCLFIWTILLSHTVTANDSAESATVKDLGDLDEIPTVYGTSMDFSSDIHLGDLKTIYFDGLDYEGNATRIYAWGGAPPEVSSSNPVPAVF